MTSRDFCFWLQGFYEIADPDTITPHQAQLIKRHLDMVFVHEIDPSHGGPAEQAKLNAIHNAPPPKPSPNAFTAEEITDITKPIMRC
jgi:hypothetical protein